MSKMILAVEFLPGTLFLTAITEAKEKAEIFDVAYIKFDFNGTRILIGQGADLDRAERDYYNQDFKAPERSVCAP